MAEFTCRLLSRHFYYEMSLVSPSLSGSFMGKWLSTRQRLLSLLSMRIAGILPTLCIGHFSA